MKDIVLSVKGLNCANCASKIENKISEMENLKDVNLDFLGEKIIFKSNRDENELISEIQKIADSIEDGVTILSTKKIENHSHSKESLEEENVKEIVKMLVIGGIIFAVALILPKIMKINEKFEFLLFLMSYIVVGHTVLITAINNIKKGQIFDENFLMSIATVGAFFVGEYPEAVAVMIFYQIGELFQEIAVKKSKKSIVSLMNIRPDYANIEKNGEIVKVSPEQIEINDVIIVKVGEKVPLDGEIVEGFSAFDTSALTGESLPREINVGEEVLSGFINKTGLVKVRVNKIFKDSTVSKILDLVQNASSKKSKTEKFITKFARYYTPAVVGIATFLAIIPPILVKGATFSEWIYRALIFLVVSCPCALVISIPLGFFGGIGGASKYGILVKGANYLEALNNIETVVFDKTGTLTKGIFKVTEINVESPSFGNLIENNANIISGNNEKTKTVEDILKMTNISQQMFSDIINNEVYTKDEVLKYTAYAESFSNHPIAQSIVKEYEKTGEIINKSLLFNFEEIAGYGIKVNFANKKLVVGNSKMMKREKIDFTEKNEIGTIVYVAVNGNYIGNLVISDEIKEDSTKAIDDLKKLGVENIVMLTGDNKKIGESIAKKLNIKNVFSELLPADKVEKIEELFKNKSEKGKILFAGDGINDAPVLARADIGVAMGGVGSDAAIEAADIVIMTDEPSKIASAIKIAKKTKVVVWQNIIFALGVKLIILALGAGGHATMWEAVFADVGVAIIAILNAMRVMRAKV